LTKQKNAIKTTIAIPVKNKTFLFGIFYYFYRKKLMNIGENIRKIRKDKDIKQHEIYDKLGISQSTYSKIENNRYKMDVNTIKEIASILEVEVTKLIGEDKIVINHTNNENGSGGSGVIVTNSTSEKLILALESQIELLKEQNSYLKSQIPNSIN
jgi:transcriptional regulator with XRE-family HTH domain